MDNNFWYKWALLKYCLYCSEQFPFGEEVYFIRSSKCIWCFRRFLIKNLLSWDAQVSSSCLANISLYYIFSLCLCWSFIKFFLFIQSNTQTTSLLQANHEWSRLRTCPNWCFFFAFCFVLYLGLKETHFWAAKLVRVWCRFHHLILFGYDYFTD